MKKFILFLLMLPLYAIADTFPLPATQAVVSVLANNGVPIPLSSLNVTYGWSSGKLVTQTVVYSGVTYIDTLTYNGDGTLASDSGWVKQ